MGRVDKYVGLLCDHARLITRCRIPAATMQGRWPHSGAFVFNGTVNSGTWNASSYCIVPTGGAHGSHSCNVSSNSISGEITRPFYFADVTPLSSSSSYSSITISPIPGKLSLGNGMAVVSHATGALLRLLRHTDGDRSRRRYRNKQKTQKSSELHG